MKEMTRKYVNRIALLVLFALLLAVLPVSAMADEADKITVAVTMEKLTLGGGFIIEPTLVTVSKNTQASVVITDLLAQKYPDIEKPYRMTGSTTSSFYLAAVYDTELAYEIPQYILDVIGEVTPRSREYLGEFDFVSTSGWMYSIDGQFPNVGAADWRLEDGQTMRWQFTLYGYGADLTGSDSTGWGSRNIAEGSGNKDDLIWAVAEFNSRFEKSELAENEAYANAMKTLENPLSQQSDIDAALLALDPEATTYGAKLMTRADLLKSAYMTLFDNSHLSAGSSDLFDDTPSRSRQFMQWAVGLNLVLGTGDGFRPYDSATLEQLAVIMYRFGEYSGMDMTARGNLDIYADADDVNGWAKEALSWAIGNNLLNAENGRLSPGMAITRERMQNGLDTLKELAVGETGG